MRTFIFPLFYFLSLGTLWSQNYEEVISSDIDGIFSNITHWAMYPNGEAGIIEHIRENITYPEEAARQGIEGRVLVQYGICTNGFVCDIVVKQGVHPLLDDEAIRIFKIMKKWVPASKNGVPVKSMYLQSINFTL